MTLDRNARDLVPLRDFDVIRTIGEERMPPTIFVTADDRDAPQAFDVHALD